MGEVIIKTGCLPYDDGSGNALHIQIEGPNGYFDYNRVILNPDSEFTDFPASDWPKVRDAIDRAVAALDALTHKEDG